MKITERTDSKGKLVERITIGSNRFVRIAETENGYIYNNILANSFEVFLKKVHTEDSDFTGHRKGHEKYPSNNDFGVWAWSYVSRDKAQKRLENLTELI